MMGYDTPFYPGWDTHGLLIGKNKMPSLGYDRKKMSVVDFRNKCEEYANRANSDSDGNRKKTRTVAQYD